MVRRLEGAGPGRALDGDLRLEEAREIGRRGEEHDDDGHDQGELDDRLTTGSWRASTRWMASAPDGSTR
jgi:hypothetical protein